MTPRISAGAPTNDSGISPLSSGDEAPAEKTRSRAVAAEVSGVSAAPEEEEEEEGNCEGTDPTLNEGALAYLSDGRALAFFGFGAMFWWMGHCRLKMAG